MRVVMVSLLSGVNSVNGMFGAKVKVDLLHAQQISIYVPHDCVHLYSSYTDMWHTKP